MTGVAHLTVPGAVWASRCGAPMDEVPTGGRRVCSACAATLLQPVPLPVREARPYCPACGQAEGHWDGCPEAAR